MSSRGKRRRKNRSRTRRPTKKDNLNLLEKAHQFVEQLPPDGVDPYPFWYGWALREAYIAGAKSTNKNLLAICKHEYERLTREMESRMLTQAEHDSLSRLATAIT